MVRYVSAGCVQEILELEPGAAWARLRLGLHHLWLARPREAIGELQAALRMDAGWAEAWEALGAAYESVGRLQAALKVYERAVELDGTRVFALTQVCTFTLWCPVLFCFVICELPHRLADHIAHEHKYDRNRMQNAQR